MQYLYTLLHQIENQMTQKKHTRKTRLGEQGIQPIFSSTQITALTSGVLCKFKAVCVLCQYYAVLDALSLSVK